MKSINFKSLDEFGNKLLSDYKYLSREEFFSIGIVAHYNEIIDISNWLTKNSELQLYSILISPPGSNGYHNEYLMNIDYKGYIWIEKAKNSKNEYLSFKNNITYVHSDVSSRFIIKNNTYNTIEFDIAGEDWEDEIQNNECIEYYRDKKEKLHGFIASRSDGDNYFSYSYCSNEELKPDILRKLLDNFGFTKGIK